MCVCVCCVTASGSLGCFQSPEHRHSVLLSRYDTSLLSIIPSVRQSHRLCRAVRHVRERVRACVRGYAFFMRRVCVLIPHSLAKSPPPQVGQLRNGSWNRHGNSSPRQASHSVAPLEAHRRNVVSHHPNTVRLSLGQILQSMSQVLKFIISAHSHFFSLMESEMALS